jgi:hypothetical protein
MTRERAEALEAMVSNHYARVVQRLARAWLARRRRQEEYWRIKMVLMAEQDHRDRTAKEVRRWALAGVLPFLLLGSWR